MRNIREAAIPRISIEPPGTRRLQLAFLSLWFIDLVAASLFFIVPHADELNPITVLFYGVFGFPGVALAATCYAGIVVVLGYVLSPPWDVTFVKLVVVLYTIFAINNVPLILFDRGLSTVIGL